MRPSVKTFDSDSALPDSVRLMICDFKKSGIYSALGLYCLCHQVTGPRATRRIGAARRNRMGVLILRILTPYVKYHAFSEMASVTILTAASFPAFT